MTSARFLVYTTALVLSSSSAGAFLTPGGCGLGTFPVSRTGLVCPATGSLEGVRLAQRVRGAALNVQVNEQQGHARESQTSYSPPSDDQEQWELDPRPAAFDEVLEMLRELDRNGSWPATSRRRSQLLKATNRRETPGDSFTIGLFPPPLRTPHANEGLPGLLDALLRLERSICPDRPCSTTITVNRHAEFKPHRDSGAGAGQSQSLIVGLGAHV